MNRLILEDRTSIFLFSWWQDNGIDHMDHAVGCHYICKDNERLIDGGRAVAVNGEGYAGTLQGLRFQPVGYISSHNLAINHMIEQDVS